MLGVDFAGRTANIPLPLKSSVTHAGQDFRTRRPRTQPQERRCRHAAQQPGGDHRAVGLRQIVARLRHHLCRGPAPLCRIAVGLCAPVPGADAEARRGLDRGPVAGHFHRAEDHLEESALHRRHGDGDLRLSAPAVRPGRRALFAGHRPADREPDSLADGRSYYGPAGGHAALHPGARGARPQRRVPQGTAGLPEARLPAGEGGRHASTRSTPSPLSTRS